jgi:hypothetical protein
MIARGTRIFLVEERALISRSVGDETRYEENLDEWIIHTKLASFNAFKRSTQFGQAPHGKWDDA